MLHRVLFIFTHANKIIGVGVHRSTILRSIEIYIFIVVTNNIIYSTYYSSTGFILFVCKNQIPFQYRRRDAAPTIKAVFLSLLSLC